MKCPNCGSRDIDFQEAGGQSVCVSCGTVLEENAIVSSIEFQESGDRSHVIGQFVSANCSKPFASGGRGFGRHGDGRDSREATLLNAKRSITQVASSLRLPPLYVDRAYRLYQLALQRNFIFGRRQTHVVATCLYIICRQEKSPHLLIDFSDALQVNVYVLGKSFLQFSSVLNLNLPVVDPSLYIHRYAARLDFSGKMNVVVTSALRVVTRLKKDWIATGRRPDGICAAAIFVAARAHGFPVTQIDLTQLFRISQDMLRHRLEEFKNTPAAQLTLDQLDSHDDNLEFDPPAYIRNIMKEAIDDKKSIIFNDVVISADDLINDDVYKVELSADSDSEASVQSKDDRTHAKAVKRETVDFTFATHNVSVPIPKRKRRKQSQVLGNKIKARGDLYDGLYQQMCGVVENSQSSTGEPKTDCDNLYSEAKNVEETLGARKVNFNKRRLNENKLVVRVALNSTKTGLFSSKSCTTNSDHNNDQEEDMAIAITLTEDEVSNYLLNEEEMSKKKIIWESCYGKFMEERERRKIDREKDSVLNSTDKYTVDGKLRKKYRKKMEQKPSSTSEAVASTGASIKGASKKINYDALKGVFNSDGSFAVPVVGDAASVVSNNSILNRPVTRREPRKNVRTESATSKLRKTAVLLGSAAPTKAVTINTAIPKPQNAVENEKDVKMDDYEDENEEVLMYEDDEMGDNYDYDDDYY